LPTNTHHTHHN